MHRHLANLGVGNSLVVASDGRTVGLKDKDGTVVDCLSKKARVAWSGRFGRIERITIFAMVRRTSENSSEEYRTLCKVPTWEVPVVEVVYS